MGGKLTVFLKQFLLLRALRCHSGRCRVVRSSAASFGRRGGSKDTYEGTDVNLLAVHRKHRGKMRGLLRKSDSGGAEWERALKGVTVTDRVTPNT